MKKLELDYRKAKDKEENKSNLKFAGSWPKLVHLNVRHSRNLAVKQYTDHVSHVVDTYYGG